MFDPNDRVAPPNKGLHIIDPANPKGVHINSAKNESGEKVLREMASTITTHKDIVKVLTHNLMFMSTQILKAVEENDPVALQAAYGSAKQFKEDLSWLKEQ